MTSALIVAAGKSTRMGGQVDKLFLSVAGHPIIAHTWLQFDKAACIDEIILVVREGRENAFHELARQYAFLKPFRIILGGSERQESVWNGLEALHPDSQIVSIHDGARPCVKEDLILATVLAAREFGAAVAARPQTDTIKESVDGHWITRTLDRNRIWSVQTPQTFRVDLIRRALSEVRRNGLRVTDDTAACEYIGHPVRLVECLQPNPKATITCDIPYIDTLLRNLQSGEQGA